MKMMIVRIVRCFSTRAIVDKWFNALQSTTHYEQQLKLAKCIEYSLEQDSIVHAKLVKDIIHRWIIEQPTTDALWISNASSDECQKLTYNDVDIQSSHLSNILTGKEFNLTAGKRVFVILPCSSKERILIQLACLRSGLMFCPYDLTYSTENDIREAIRRSAVDCIITNRDYLEVIMSCTHNSLRPLKKGLVNHCSRSEPLPIGWHSLMDGMNALEIGSIQSAKPSWHHLINDTPMNQRSQGGFSLLQLLAAYWLSTKKSSGLIWMKDNQDSISLAPWLLGSRIFYQETDDIKTTLKTFENYPIETFWASQCSYHMLDQQQQQLENSTHLKQLLSTEPIVDLAIKTRWYSLTNLHIQDDCPDLTKESDTQSIFSSCLTTAYHHQLENNHATSEQGTPALHL